MRGRVMVVGTLSVVVCLAFASVVSAASHPQERHGFWIGFGFGVGSANVTCDDCGSSNRETAAAGYLKLGGTLNEHLLLGGEVNVWSKKQEGVTLTLSSGAVTLTLYPQPASGLFIKGGVGLSMVDTQFREGSTTVTIDPGYGLGVIVGAGYDVRVGKNVSITPAVNFWYGKPGNVPHDGDPLFTNWKQNVVDFTVGVTFH
jgi:outer membrane protein with beta-barrel domain